VTLYFVGDVHLGNHRTLGGSVVAGVNQRAQQTLNVIRAAKAHACRHEEETNLFVLGDLFDTSNPTPQLVTAAMEALWPKSHPLSVHLLAGNHDLVSDEDGDHALGPFVFVPRMDVYEAPCARDFGADEATVLLVPYRSGHAKEWLPGALVELLKGYPSHGRRLLLLHLGIHDAAMRAALPWTKDAADAVSIEQLQDLCAAHGIESVVAGNWHARKRWRTSSLDVLQVGALVPTGWDNPGLRGLYGTVASFGPGGLSVYELPGPRFVTVTEAGALNNILDEADEQDLLYVRWKTAPSNVEGVTAHLRELREGGIIAGFTVQIEQEALRAQAQAASQRARSAETLQEALAHYVAGVALEEGIDRAEVLDRAREYLG